MFQVETYGRVRRAVRVEGRSQRAVAREFWALARDGAEDAALRGASRPASAAGQEAHAGAVAGVIDVILEEDKQRPAKQRHSARRAAEALEEEARLEHPISHCFCLVVSTSRNLWTQ